MAALLVRWSWRDLRARWLQVAAVAVIAGLGAGVFAGLGSGAPWRRANYDASYAAARTHDLLVETAAGTTVDAAALATVTDQARHPEWFTGVTVRLTAPSQVEIRRAGEKDVLVPARLVGVDTSTRGGPPIDRIAVLRGRGLGPADVDRDVVVLDQHFGRVHDLAPSGTLISAGGRPLRWVGQGLSPQYFWIDVDQASMLGARGFAVMYTSIETVQRISAQPGQANEAGVAIADGVDPDAARRELQQALAKTLPDAAMTVTRLDAERAYRTLYDDIDGDQKLVNIFGVLIMAGAAFAAFNLTTRIVEAQRREIGIGMAIGAPRAVIAVRPLLVSAQIALLGVVAGIAIGMWLGNFIGAINQRFFTMPVWRTPFQPAVFARGAVLAFGLIFLAAAIPVRRAVSIAPVDAIQTRPSGPTRTRAGRQHLRLPGRSLAQLPVRNVLRAPRRTALTALAIAAVVATLIGVIGMVDSLVATIGTGERDLLRRSPDRMQVSLASFTSPTDPRIEALGEIEGVAVVEPALRVGGQISRGDESFPVVIDFVDPASRIWAPTTVDGTIGGPSAGVVVSQKAARDLGVGVGDRVTLRHPYRVGAGYEWRTSRVPVTGIHANPYRFLVYMEGVDAELMNLAGVVNTAQVLPEPGADLTAVRRAVFFAPGVGSVQQVSAFVETIRDALAELTNVLDIVEYAVLLLAVLIAFNATSINADERVREHATMFAFGVPVRSVMAVQVTESTLIGLMATVVGAAAGTALVAWIARVLLPTTLPDLEVTPMVSASTYLTAAVLGVVAVAAAPLLTIRRLRRMDVPAKLRVVE